MADIVGSSGTTTTLSIGGSVTSVIDRLGDVDWVRVSLSAGQTYNFTVSAPIGSSTPLQDSVLTLYSGAGTQLAFNDDANGYYSEIQFTATQTGTYYLAVGAYNDSMIGDYVVQAEIAPPARPTDSLDMNYEVPTNVVRVYFVPNAGVTIVEPDGTSYQTTAGWTANQIDLAMIGFQQISNVANIDFVVTNQVSSVDFVMIQGTADDALGYFGFGGGQMSVGGTSVEVDGYGNFNSEGAGWTDSGLQQGGYGFVTLIHEVGHGLGLAHPHDDALGSTIMLGVTSPFDSYGVANLNQGINTVMSYNDGWQFAPHGVSSDYDYGWTGTMMALDIAVLQEKYGANLSYHTGDDTYLLPSLNRSGTFYSSIWDAGGSDVIVHNGTTGAVIDLRAASLEYDEFGGGPVSYAAGIHGGFTIANGVVIENATGGYGSDTITGNEVGNILVGRSGSDVIRGGNGNDHISGDESNDQLYGDGGDDSLYGGAGSDRLHGGDGNDTVCWDANDDLANVLGGLGSDTLLLTGELIPVGFDLLAHQFERALAQIADTANVYNWSSRTTVYTSAWAMSTDEGTYDSGASWIANFDITDAGAWYGVRNEYDALHRLTATTTTYDAGNSATNQFDVGNSFAWQTQWTSRDTIGNLDIQVQVNDNGSRTTLDWDAGNRQNWTTNWYVRNAAANLDIQVIQYDNGTQATTDYDLTNIASWRSNWFVADAEGDIDIQVITYDNGSKATTDHDLTDAYGWATIWQLTTAAGALDMRVEICDDGCRTSTNWDQDGAYSWTYVSQQFDASGQLLGTTTRYDDGTLLIS